MRFVKSYSADTREREKVQGLASPLFGLGDKNNAKPTVSA